MNKTGIKCAADPALTVIVDTKVYLQHFNFNVINSVFPYSVFTLVLAVQGICCAAKLVLILLCVNPGGGLFLEHTNSDAKPQKLLRYADHMLCIDLTAILQK